VNLNDVWSAGLDGDTAVWVVGDAGTALLFANGVWDTVATNTTVDLNSVHGTSPSDVYAVGDDDTFVVLDPVSGGTAGTLGTGVDLTGVWSSAADGGRVFAVGAEGAAMVRESGSLEDTRLQSRYEPQRRIRPERHQCFRGR